LLARRRLFAAIAAGIGRPEAHGALGELLLRHQLKYALLELKAAAFLNPRDLRARHDLVVGLTTVRMDEPARRELKGLLQIEPAWAADSGLTAARRTLDARSGTGTVVEF
jgi:Flp pilus assembly protein TadD